jgi:DNA-binding response OmpR family regulator
MNLETIKPDPRHAPWVVSSGPFPDIAPPSERGAVLRFGPFELTPKARRLTRGGVPIEVGSRAFDLLVRLLQSRGEVVTKAEIMAHVWPCLFIEESNLRFQVAQLRRSLGDHGTLIKTIPGRGYLLAADEAGAEAELGPIRIAAPAGRVNGNGSGGAAPEADDTARLEPGRPVVALIDPDEEANEAIRSLLARYGMQVQHYRSAEEFIAGGLATDVGCVILDVWLPGMTGLQLQAEFTAAGALVPFIFVSSHADVDAAVRAMKAGASEFFTKPVRHLDLLEAVKRAVRSNAAGGRAAEE